MADAGTAVFRAIADFSSVVKESQKGAEALDDFAGSGQEKRSSKFKSAIGTVTKVAGLATAAIGTIFSAKAISAGYDRLTTIQDATAALTVQFQDAGKAAAFMDDIVKVVTGTPYNLDQFAAAGAQLVGYGVEAQKVPKYLTAIGEASARGGKQAGEFADRLSTAFGRAQASGKISMDTINSLSDVGVNGLVILANAFGVTTAEMQKMISKGAVPAEKGLDLLSKGIMEGSTGVAGSTQALQGTMAGLRETLSGARGGFSAAIARFGANVLSPFTGMLTKGFTGAATIIDSAGKTINGALTKFAEGPGGKAVERMLDGIVKAVPAVVTLLTQGYTPAVREAMGWEEDAPIVDQILRIRDAFTGLRDLLVGGEFTTAFRQAFNVEEDAPIVGTLLFIRDTAIDSWTRLKALGEGLWGTFQRLVPAVASIAGSLGVASAAIGISTWQVLLSVLEATATVLDVTLVPALEWLGEWMKDNQGTVNVLVGAYTAWRLAMMGLAGFRAVMAGIAAVQTAYTAATYGAVGATYAQGAAAKVGAVAARAYAVAQWLVNAAMSANPIALIVIAIAALVAAFIWAWNNVDGFAEFWIGVWDAIKNAFSAAVEWIGTTWTSFTTWLGETASSIGDWFTGVWDRITGAFSSAMDWLKENWATVVAWIIAPGPMLVAAIINNWDQIAAWFANMGDRIVAAWNAVVEWVKTTAQSFADWIVVQWNRIPEVWQQILDSVSAWWDRTTTSIKNGALATVEWLIAQFVRFREGVKNAIDNVGTFFKELPGKIWGWLYGLVDKMVSFGSDIMTGLITGVASAAKKVFDAIWKPIKDATDKVKSALGIRSPSRVFAWIGRMTMEGTVMGVDQGAPEVVGTYGSVAEQVADAFDVGRLLNPDALISNGALGGSAPGAGAAVPASAVAPAPAGAAPLIGEAKIYNPVPERASDSLATLARRTTQPEGQPQ